MIYIVDTHPLVWFLEGDSRLSDSARLALADMTVQLAIPTIVLAEVSFLYAKQRININLPAVLAHMANHLCQLKEEAVTIPVYGLGGKVSLENNKSPKSQSQGDPHEYTPTRRPWSVQAPPSFL